MLLELLGREGIRFDVHSGGEAEVIVVSVTVLVASDVLY